MKKKTPTQKYIDKAVSQTAEKVSGTHVTDCNFQMEINNGEALEAIANALGETAKALGVLAGSIQKSNISGLTIANMEKS